jgi:cytochrome oxidase Cu insertion factor (SCO1/SenC/PrrC family)
MRKTVLPAALLAVMTLSVNASIDPSAETRAVGAIHAANGSFTLSELSGVVRTSSECCRQSEAVSRALTEWLRESHPIYAGRLPTEASQFRGFLLASLGSFPPNEELYSYLKTEFLFPGHPFSIAAAAIAARSFPGKSEELVPLMESFLGDTFLDPAVDVTTPALNYPLAHPTRARYEILRTLTLFGCRADRSLPLLDAIVACRYCGTYGADPALPGVAAAAAEAIRKTTPAPLAGTGPGPRGLQVIDKKNRKPLSAGALRLIDQDGTRLRLADLRGRPFALTFFYTQCTNTSKCIMTVRRLGALATECMKNGLGERVGVYGMTYDPHFDSPSILKKYGDMHGMKFGRHVRLLKTINDLAPAFRDELALRVSYGAGTVNQHGIQLFVFDKKGRLAATHDNELWSATDVRNLLAQLAAE